MSEQQEANQPRDNFRDGVIEMARHSNISHVDIVTALQEAKDAFLTGNITLVGDRHEQA